ncbi:translocation protein Sec62-domain-containing protein [Geopyxis carbonaria]|nr:translocation protein Sec62-domain-containing protein [Geopyxis carbonaria]
MSGPPQQVQEPQAPSPEALAVADYLKSVDIKARTCILQGQRKDLFKVKRAVRALESDHYKAACKKNPLLPKVENRQEAIRAFSLLPRSLLALRVSKVEPEDGAKNPKRVKGLWTVKVEPQQEIREDLYYAFFYEPRTWKQTAMAVGLVALLLTVVMFPLWPPMLRLGVWYLSMGMLGLIGLFIVMSIFRLILFVISMVVTPPGLWLYPNLFEDVGFFDSFRPLWAWHKSKAERMQEKAAAAAASPAASAPSEKAAPAPTTPVPKVPAALTARKPTVEEVEE